MTLPCALVAVGEGERLDACRCDPDAVAGTGSVADGVLGGSRLVGPDAGVGELRFHDDVSQGCVLACANKNGVTVRYAERRQDKGKTHQLAQSRRRFLVAHRLRPSYRLSQKYLAPLIASRINSGRQQLSAIYRTRL